MSRAFGFASSPSFLSRLYAPAPSTNSARSPAATQAKPSSATANSCPHFGIIAADWERVAGVSNCAVDYPSLALPGLCVEVATNLPHVIGVRDSKDPTGPTLTFTPAQWTTFTTTIRSR